MARPRVLVRMLDTSQFNVAKPANPPLCPHRLVTLILLRRGEVKGLGSFNFDVLSFFVFLVWLLFGNAQRTRLLRKAELFHDDETRDNGMRQNRQGECRQDSCLSAFPDNRDASLEMSFFHGRIRTRGGPSLHAQVQYEVLVWNALRTTIVPLLK